MKTRLDIAIGPVQGFVAQSRRTRDLWGSSYLLSFLSAHAMRGAAEADGYIVRPVVDHDPLYQWVAGLGEGDAPRIGSVPNRFVVEVEAGRPVRLVAAAAGQALQDAWRRVCGAVRESYLEHALGRGDGTDAIWTRQVEAFWEVTWTAGDAASGGGLLPRRKHWRTHRLPDEPGDKCTVMPDLQELSGHVRAAGSEARKQQDDFWVRVRQRLGDLDLRKNERLCAVAFVKRLFPKVPDKALGWPVETTHWPSTVYVAAVPWIRRVMSNAAQPARLYAEAVRQSVSGVLTEGGMLDALPSAVAGGDFVKLDANYFHRERVLSERLCPLPDDASIASSGARRELAERLQAVYDARDAGGELGPPPTFYALLLADGDRLGQLVGNLGGESVSRALSMFTSAVPGMVRQHHGVTIYAGGDDVLAMLPVSGALDCAAALADAYTSAFTEEARSKATLSVAVAFAQIRLPLAEVIRAARRLLDEVAKDGNGRDSLAAGVLKPGGLHCQWTTTWKRHGATGDSVCAVASLHRLSESFQERAGKPGLSSSLVYRIRDLLARLCEWNIAEPGDRPSSVGSTAAGAAGWRPGDWGWALAGVDLRTFLRAEIGHSVAVNLDDGADARADDLTDRVREMLAPSRRAVAGDDRPGAEVGVDALLLARFLAAGGYEEAGG